MRKENALSYESNHSARFEEIMKEWDYEKNGELRPEQFTRGSNKKVWWKCKDCGMSWEAKIANRTHGRGCPYDAGQRPISGKTDLATLRPDIAAEWDCVCNGSLQPEHFTVSSNKKVWWKCLKCGQRWQATIASRTSGCGCPYDSGRLPIPGKTDLATLYPDIASEWDYDLNQNLRPDQFTAGSSRKVWWKCKNCDQSWQASILNRSHGTNCPFDSGLRPIPGKTDLATLHPDIASEWDYDLNQNLRPEQFTAGSKNKVWWRCRNCGQSWQSQIVNRTLGTKCPYDAGKLPIPGRTDLATLYPDIASEWDHKLNGGLQPWQCTAGSRTKIWWKCKNCGMSWKSSIADRVRGYGCPFDSGRFPIPGKTDLATLHPDLAAEWDYERNGTLKPEQFAAGSNKKVWWKCKNCGMRWKASIVNRTRGRGCPYDAGRLPIPGKTDLATLHPNLAFEWDYERNGTLKPEQFTAGSNKKVWWKCKNCSQSWQAIISSRSKGCGCPYDAGRLPIPGKTDLVTLRPNLVEEWDYDLNENLDPEQFTEYSGRNVWWKCKKCGHRWQAKISNRTANGRGCPSCNGKKSRKSKTP